MRLNWLPLVGVLCVLAPPAPAQKKEMVELGRDLALLQEEVRSMNKTQNDRLSAMENTLKAIQDDLAATRRGVTVLDTGLRDRLEKSMVAPMASVSGKVDNMSQDFGYIRESVAEVNTRLGKLDQRLADLENAIRTMQAPAAPPAPASSGSGSAATAAPAGVSAKSLYEGALRDKSGGNSDLALKGFTDYLRWFGDTEYAPNAQYYIGEIYFTQKQYEPAVNAFDKVLEAYTKNPKTLAARLLKGKALAKLDRRADAEKEFRAIISGAPSSDEATSARLELRLLTGNSRVTRRK
jgi:TolA-binding protein